MTSETKQAFLTAVERTHGVRLRRFLASRMRNAAADVQDLMQEVFLRLLRIDNHETIRNPQAYLYTVASHVLHQYMLKQSTTSAALNEANVTSALESVVDTDPATQVELEQRFEELGRALQQTFPKAYATLVMHRCHGVPLKEIGVRLGISHSMVKRHLAKALTYCQQRLDEAE